MFLSIPIWKEDPATQSEADPQVSISPIKVIRIKGVKSMLIAFLCYCAIEGVNFVWASSYFNNGFGISGERAAKLASLYYCGMMIGRVISGFVADRMGDKKMIRIGSIIILIASALMYLFNNYYTSIAGFLLSGLGSGPIYPSLIHETPENFERKYSQSIIGVQMASAYTGSLFSPYLFGLLAEHLDIKLLPLIVLVLDVFVFLFAELYHRNTGKK